MNFSKHKPHKWEAHDRKSKWLAAQRMTTKKQQKQAPIIIINFFPLICKRKKAKIEKKMPNNLRFASLPDLL